MKKEIKIIGSIQQNSFYNEAKKCDGGGYDQSLIYFEFDGIDGSFNDTSCGSFGYRYYIKWNDKYYSIDEVSINKYKKSDFSKELESDMDFIRAFKECFNIHIPTIEELE